VVFKLSFKEPWIPQALEWEGRREMMEALACHVCSSLNQKVIFSQIHILGSIVFTGITIVPFQGKKVSKPLDSITSKSPSISVILLQNDCYGLTIKCPQYSNVQGMGGSDCIDRLIYRQADNLMGDWKVRETYLPMGPWGSDLGNCILSQPLPFSLSLPAMTFAALLHHTVPAMFLCLTTAPETTKQVTMD
jgi:hypothetical protein